MTLKSQREFENTRRKLDCLEARYTELSAEAGGDEELREAERESVRRAINQLKEELARFEAQQHVRR